jgi:ribosome-associated protein
MSLAGIALVKEIVRLAENSKAGSISIMDLRGLEAPADFFVVCSGEADTHVKAIYGGIAEGLRLNPVKTKPMYVDGLEDCSWVALDFFDVIAHIFLPEKRLYYAIERLWDSAKIYTPAEIPVLEGGPAVVTPPAAKPARKSRPRASAKPKKIARRRPARPAKKRPRRK